MTTLTLPGPERPYTTPLNLALIETLEQDTNLLQVAERLAARDMKLAETVTLLCRIYRCAGCDMADAALEQFLLTQAPAILLADILLMVLTPLARAGVIDPAKKPSTSG
ncbi:MAG: hypothetical protein PW788_02630 [Micavibrio sp.]|nr:hypothetical protein [Micavibrio sp.]